MAATIPMLLDCAGIAFFSATGALSASRKQLDVVGFIFLGTITGIGGGTIRDLVLDVPVFWVQQPYYILICALSAILVYFIAHKLESRYRLLLWLDAVALAAYGIFGTYKGLAVSHSPTVAVVMGMLTGTAGGILRDVIAGEPSVIMRKEIYITAVILGAVTYVLLEGAGLAAPIPSVAGALVAFVCRSGAIAYGWSLPQYKPHAAPPR